MWSGDHFDKEIKCTMTDLSGIIESCSDTIFTVQFKKMVDQKDVEAKLEATSLADLKNNSAIKDFSKSIVEGKTVQITGHLV